MKKAINLFGVLIIIGSLGFWACTKNTNNSASGNGNITISVNSSQIISTSSLKSDSIAMGNIHSIVVTIEDASGKTVVNGQQITLYNMSGVFISTPIALNTGSYTLTNFLVLDQDNNVLYAAPLKNSTKASLVNNALPLSFSIQLNNVTNVKPEVISTNGCTPQDFGYTTFGFNIESNFNFLIGAFIYNSSVNNYQLTPANISIYIGSSTTGNPFKSIPLSGKASSTSTFDTLGITNEISLPESNSIYTLVVSKQGYQSYQQTFNTTDLEKYFYSCDNGPLIVILNPTTTTPWLTFNLKNGLPSDSVSGSTIDSKGNVWFATEQGVCIYNGENLTVYNSTNSGLVNNKVQQIAFDQNGNAWIGTNYGVSKFDGTNWTTFNNSNCSLPNSRIISVAVDSKNNVWFGSYGGGFTVYNGSNWTNYNTGNSMLQSDFIFGFYFDNQGNTWISAWDNGLTKFDGTNWTVYNPTYNGINNGTNQAAFDNQGNLWVATVFSGLDKYNSGIWTEYETNNFFYAVVIDNLNDIWGGTYGSGLYELNNGIPTFYNTTNSGICGNNIRGLTLDANNNIWISTIDGGVSRYSYLNTK